MKIKTCLLFLMFCFAANSGCQAASRINPSGTENESPDNQALKSDPTDIFKRNLVENQQIKLDTLKSATFYQIELKIDDSLISISGHQNVLYTNEEKNALDKLYFSLIPNTGGDYLKVKNIQINGAHAAGSILFNNSVLEIVLPEPLQAGESLEISMDFSETVPEQMGGNYGLYIFQDGILALDSFFPIIPVYDENGWNVQDPPRNADLIYTDAAFFEVRVDAPKDLVLVASGSEISKQIVKDRQVITFAGGPQRDFYLAASPRFQSASEQAGEVRITSYYPREFSQSGDLVLETAVKALQVFSKLYGQYPYTELDLVSTPMQAGGMEYSGAAAMALGIYEEGNTASGAPNSDFLEFATVHEVAHQWFFNQVMNDQVEEPWLDEGLAQYLTYIYYLDTYGREAAEQIHATFERHWLRANRQPIPIGMPAVEYNPDQYAAIIYGRAPLFILELEKNMGAEVFSRFLADYVSKYQWKTVNSQQFQSMAQETCGCDLTGLFEKWWAFD